MYIFLGTLSAYYEHTFHAQFAHCLHITAHYLHTFRAQFAHCLHTTAHYPYTSHTLHEHAHTHLGSVEDILYGQHRDDGEYFLRAAEVDTLDEHLAELGLQRELRHPPTQAGKEPLVIQR